MDTDAVQEIKSTQESGVWSICGATGGGGGQTTALDEETSLSGLPTRNGV